MKLLINHKDSRSIIIPCTVGDRTLKKSLINLDSSVGIIFLSMYKKVGIGRLNDTNMTFQFTDNYIKHPHNIVEDVLINVNKFIFLVDFFVLDMP